MDLETFLTDVALVSDLDSHNSSTDAISLMTLHSAKGLEFDVVFMVGMEEGVFPHSRSFFEPEELEEERRLCYVGMTRARQELYMIHASSRLLYGNTQHNLPSRFIADIPEEIIDLPNGGQSLSHQPQFNNEDFPQEDYELPSLSEGDEVRHPLFGDGKVVSIDDSEATIYFKRVGKKTLNLQYAPLHKI
jgi:DNA helicase-2/ATP-dependent DNA helicase PcrA